MKHLISVPTKPAAGQTTFVNRPLLAPRGCAKLGKGHMLQPDDKKGSQEIAR